MSEAHTEGGIHPPGVHGGEKAHTVDGEVTDGAIGGGLREWGLDPLALSLQALTTAQQVHRPCLAEDRGGEQGTSMELGKRDGEGGRAVEVNMGEGEDTSEEDDLLVVDDEDEEEEDDDDDEEEWTEQEHKRTASIRKPRPSSLSNRSSSASSSRVPAIPPRKKSAPSSASTSTPATKRAVNNGTKSCIGKPSDKISSSSSGRGSGSSSSSGSGSGSGSDVERYDPSIDATAQRTVASLSTIIASRHAAKPVRGKRLFISRHASRPCVI